MRGIFEVAAGLLAAAVLAGCAPATGARDAEPSYTVAREDGAFEIRDYGPRVVAQYTARGLYRRAVEQGYLRLERYFTGENTVPEAIPIRMPVMARKDDADGWTTMLVLPDGYRAETAPRPVDEDIRIVELPPRRVAAVTFSGEPSEAMLREQAAALEAWLDAQGLAHEGDFTLAGYDRGWKPGLLRSNEVLVTLR